MFIDPHIHMVSRTTDDYARLAEAGCVAVGEPAFWAGFDRGPEAFRSYFDQLTVHEPKRAAAFGIEHRCWLCLNPKEARDPAKADAVLELLPEYLCRPSVVGVGETGLDRNTRQELDVFERHLDLAIAHGCRVLVHTPHLEDKLRGTRIILDALQARAAELPPDRVLIDHVEEHTIGMARDAGHWVGVTVYPVTKTSPRRAAAMLERHGPDRIWVNSACDWGRSDPAAVPRLRVELRRRGMPASTIRRITLDNPAEFMELDVPDHPDHHSQPGQPGR